MLSGGGLVSFCHQTRSCSCVVQMNWEAPTLRETARFAVRSGRSGAYRRLLLLLFAVCYVFFLLLLWQEEARRGSGYD